MPWYRFTPGGFFRDISNPNNYTLVGSTPPSCPFPKDSTCALQALDNAGKPIITRGTVIDILIALSTGSESVTVKLKP
ncbi:hypothetical protein [Sphingobacterium faecium]|uniref:hypothetical protein n=1 Tax=Sphingobacterium faecium TaxID=34087 RepID=UPI003208CF0B